MIHELANFDPIGDHYTYETNEEAYLVATSDAYPAGVYVNEHNPDDFFIKAILNDGKYAVGFLLRNSSNKSLYRATEDGGMIKDEDTWVSVNEAEIYLVNAEQAGFRPFEQLSVEYDRFINVTTWYRLIEPKKVEQVKTRKPRKKRNESK